jgi:plastocyanin
MRRFLVMLVVLAGSAVVGVPGASSQPLVSISIVDDPRPQEAWGFAPATRRVPVGTWVTWSNDGSEAHTVTATDGSFDSGNLNPSEGFSWQFDQNGTYEYVCSLHDWMVGKVIVGTGVAPAPPPVDESSDG